MYSCALWSEAEGGVRGDLVSGPTPGDLEAAQLRKIRYVLTAAKVKPGDRILEFGSGWGGMAIEVRCVGSVCATIAHFRSFRLLALLAAKSTP
jgi:cyclopropane fatty-acyl-phospholipid synthase-like methyltransferase